MSIDLMMEAVEGVRLAEELKTLKEDLLTCAPFADKIRKECCHDPNGACWPIKRKPSKQEKALILLMCKKVERVEFLEKAIEDTIGRIAKEREEFEGSFK
jgi:hypothetical protein